MKNTFLLLMSVLILFSCSSNDVVEDVHSSNGTVHQGQTSVQLSLKQAKAYASLFSKGFKGTDAEATTRAASLPTPTIKNVEFLIEGKDTLLYAINYSNNRGYVILSGANNAFPIIGHANSGTVELNNIDKNTPFATVIEAYKKQVKAALEDKTATQSEYYQNWKDLGKDGYEYEVELINSAPATRGRRKESSGKTTIYPCTGKDLDRWCQKGGFNYYAENKILIGCPAIAIGMLMYDTDNRIDGNYQNTIPYFYLLEREGVVNAKDSTLLAKKLRYIADKIPNYHWATNLEHDGSGASDNDILQGLHNLGYTKAECKPYNFEELYKNLQFKGYNYFGQETTMHRGVLIAAGVPYSNAGHIWFCDGYYEQGYKVKRKFLGIKVKSWNEYEDCLYMNWGWGTDSRTNINYNGWYTANDDVWNSTEEKGSIDLKFRPNMFVNLSYYETPRK